MRSRADEEANAVPGAVEFVPAARLRVDCSRAVRRKVVFGGRHHQPGKRRRHFEEVGHVETACEKRREAHFRIGRGTGEQSAERIDEAARRGRFDARLEDADIGRNRAAARAAGYADAIGVDVGTADEIVDRAFGVEDEVSRYALADEDVARAEFEMLVAAASRERPAQLRQIRLLALALPDRVVGERDESLRRQVRGDNLRFGFAFLRVARWHEDRRVASGCVRSVEVGGDVEAGEAFEDDLLDRVRVALKAAGDASIERAVVRWQTSDELGQLGAHHRLAPVRIGPCADCGDRALAVVKLLLRDAVEPGEKRIGRWRLWEAHRRSEAKHGRESRHQPMIDRFERIVSRPQHRKH